MRKLWMILCIVFLVSCTVTKTETKGKGKNRKTVTTKKRIL